MLYLTRRQGEAVIIDNEITIRVVELRGRSVKLGITFPAGVSVLREELFLQIRDANEAASRSAAALDGWDRDDPPSDPAGGSR